MLTDDYYIRLFTEPLEIDTPEKAERFIEALEKAKAIAEEKNDEEIENYNTDDSNIK